MSIEVFELAGYVVQAGSVNAELAVFATEIRPYVVQQAASKTAVVVSDTVMYVVQSPKSKTGVAFNSSVAYVIGHEEIGSGFGEVSSKNGTRLRYAGVAVPRTSAYEIVSSQFMTGLHVGMNIKNREPGVAVMNTSMYSIDIP